MKIIKVCELMNKSRQAIYQIIQSVLLKESNTFLKHYVLYIAYENNCIILVYFKTIDYFLVNRTINRTVFNQ